MIELPEHPTLLADVRIATQGGHAVRAVGTACGATPVWLVIPCHRIVRSSGDLAGYAGGLERKEWLLEHERRHRLPRAPSVQR